MIGIDIIETKRIKRLIKNKRFIERVFSIEEIKYCENKKNRAQHYAARFAAKEAIWKALAGRYSIPLKDIVIKNIQNGKPEVFLKDKKLKNFKIEVSLSHTKEYAVAVAICFSLLPNAGLGRLGNKK
ncbi:MAG: holo-ACP synthase [Elusimicrobiota bacterium]|nr:holo-ACP synthase [Endomicrobiia bacterium]MDW8165722.1 holo-ACP synthase [Elusimicrobiota bacterium]